MTKYLVEHQTQHTDKFGRRVFRVYENTAEYAYAHDLAENHDHARWYGFGATLPECFEVDCLTTAVVIAQ